MPFDVAESNGSLYVLDSYNQRVQKWTLNNLNSSAISRLTGIGYPYYFFIDHDQNIYLSLAGDHRISFYLSNSTTDIVVAGTGVAGANADQLNNPYGIFVNREKTIYIADCGNHRIMKWSFGASTGTVVAGNGTVGSSLAQLNTPTQVIVDTNGFLYISESNNGRITRWGPNSTYGVCIAACTGASGSASDQFIGPHSLAFDSYGSLYVNDRYNNRIQKFQILTQNSTYSIIKVYSAYISQNDPFFHFRTFV